MFRSELLIAVTVAVVAFGGVFFARPAEAGPRGWIERAIASQKPPAEAKPTPKPTPKPKPEARAAKGDRGAGERAENQKPRVATGGGGFQITSATGGGGFDEAVDLSSRWAKGPVPGGEEPAGR